MTILWDTFGHFDRAKPMAAIKYKKFFDLDAVIKSIGVYLPNFDKKRFLSAFNFAERAHKDQFRKDDKTPYIAHPVETVKILITLRADEDTLISALLHDVPEDTKYELQEIQNLFGDKIAFLVDGVTKLSKVHYQNNMPERQVESLKKLLLHSVEDARVVLIKLADRMHNMQTLENIKEPEKRLRIATETLEIYVPLANLLGIRELKSKMEDLCFKQIAPAQYKELKEKMQHNEKKGEANAESFITTITEVLKKEGVKDFKIYGRRKNIYSIFKKLSASGKTINDVDDRIAVNVIVNETADCYQVLGAIHTKFVPKTDRFKDYIANPKINGYQSLHTTVFGIGGVLTEIQIRTKKMEIFAEYGVASNIATNIKSSSWGKKILEIEKEDKGSDSFLENLKLDIFQDRIFVFTPKGAPVDLPKDASVIDFAYGIHTELGHHASKARINGQIKPVSTTLKTGDTVEIITSKRVYPELAWFSFVRTNLAKNKILAYLKKVSKDKKIEEGHRILQKEFDIAGLGLCTSVNFKKLKNNIELNLGKTVKNLEELFIVIGEGEIKASDIVGLVEGGGKMSIAKGIRINIKISAKNRFGLMRDISEVLYKHALDMYSLKGWASRYEVDAYFTAELLVKDALTISKLFDELEQIEEVLFVHRVSHKGMVLFYVATCLVIAAWIMHPFILRFASETSFRNNYPKLATIMLYGGFCLIFFAIFYLANIVKKYFPIVRNKKLLWVGVFSLPILAIGMLAVEIFVFKLDLSWLVILVEILAIYGYLGLNYSSFKKSIPKT